MGEAAAKSGAVATAGGGRRQAASRVCQSDRWAGCDQQRAMITRLITAQPCSRPQEPAERGTGRAVPQNACRRLQRQCLVCSTSGGQSRRALASANSALHATHSAATWHHVFLLRRLLCGHCSVPLCRLATQQRTVAPTTPTDSCRHAAATPTGASGPCSGCAGDLRPSWCRSQQPAVEAGGATLRRTHCPPTLTPPTLSAPLCRRACPPRGMCCQAGAHGSWQGRQGGRGAEGSQAGGPPRRAHDAGRGAAAAERASPQPVPLQHQRPHQLGAGGGRRPGQQRGALLGAVGVFAARPQGPPGPQRLLARPPPRPGALGAGQG